MYIVCEFKQDNADCGDLSLKSKDQPSLEFKKELRPETNKEKSSVQYSNTQRQTHSWLQQRYVQVHPVTLERP